MKNSNGLNIFVLASFAFLASGLAHHRKSQSGVIRSNGNQHDNHRYNHHRHVHHLPLHHHNHRYRRRQQIENPIIHENTMQSDGTPPSCQQKPPKPPKPPKFSPPTTEQTNDDFPGSRLVAVTSNPLKDIAARPLETGPGNFHNPPNGHPSTDERVGNRAPVRLQSAVRSARQLLHKRLEAEGREFRSKSTEASDSTDIFSADPHLHLHPFHSLPPPLHSVNLSVVDGSIDGNHHTENYHRYHHHPHHHHLHHQQQQQQQQQQNEEMATASGNFSASERTNFSWETGILATMGALISLLTVGGNLIVILSFFLERAIRQPANYFIASLAVSDLLIGLVSMPLYTVYVLTSKRWTLGEVFCDVWLSIDYTACLCSIYTVFCITIDRFCSIKIPTKYRLWRTEKKILIVVSFIWVIPISVFFTTIFGWQYFVGKRTVPVNKCFVQYMEDALFNCILQVGYFWITLVAMVVLYSGIYKVALDLHRKSEAKKKKQMSSLACMAERTVGHFGAVIGGLSRNKEMDRALYEVTVNNPWMTAESGLKINADGSVDKKKPEDEEIEKDFKTSKSLFGLFSGSGDLDSDDSSSSLCQKRLTKQGSNISRATDPSASSSGKFLQVPKVDHDKEEKKVRKMALRKLNSLTSRRQSSSLSEANKKSTNPPLHLLRATGFIARHQQRFLKRQLEINFSASTDLPLPPKLAPPSSPPEPQATSTFRVERSGSKPAEAEAGTPTALDLALPTVVITGSSDSLGMTNRKRLSGEEEEGGGEEGEGEGLVVVVGGRFCSSDSNLVTTISNHATDATEAEDFIAQQASRTKGFGRSFLSRQQNIARADSENSSLDLDRIDSHGGLATDDNERNDGEDRHHPNLDNRYFPCNLESKMMENLEQLSANFKTIKTSLDSERTLGVSSRRNDKTMSEERASGLILGITNHEKEPKWKANRVPGIITRRRHLQRQANISDSAFLPLPDSTIDPLCNSDDESTSPVNGTPYKDHPESSDKKVGFSKRSEGHFDTTSGKLNDDDDNDDVGQNGCQTLATTCAIGESQTPKAMTLEKCHLTYGIDTCAPTADAATAEVSLSKCGASRNPASGCFFPPLSDESEGPKMECDLSVREHVIERASNFLLGSHEAYCPLGDSIKAPENNLQVEPEEKNSLNELHINNNNNNNNNNYNTNDDDNESLGGKGNVGSPESKCFHFFSEAFDGNFDGSNVLKQTGDRSSQTRLMENARNSARELLISPKARENEVAASTEDAWSEVARLVLVSKSDPETSRANNWKTSAAGNDGNSGEGSGNRDEIHESKVEARPCKTNSKVADLLLAPDCHSNVIRRKSSSFTARLSQSILKTFHQREMDDGDDNDDDDTKKQKSSKGRRSSDGVTGSMNNVKSDRSDNRMSWNDKTLKLFKQEAKTLLNRHQGEQRQSSSSGGGGGKNSPSLQSNVSSKSNKNFGPPPRVTTAAFWNFITGRYSNRRGTSESLEAERRRQRQQKKTENRARKALRTITIILGAFIVCWTPWHVLSLIMGFCSEHQLECVSPVLYDVSYWLCYLNSPLNPFCYAFVNQQFKQTFIRIIRFDFRRN